MDQLEHVHPYQASDPGEGIWSGMEGILLVDVDPAFLPIRFRPRLGLIDVT